MDWNFLTIIIAVAVIILYVRTFMLSRGFDFTMEKDDFEQQKIFINSDIREVNKRVDKLESRINDLQHRERLLLDHLNLAYRTIRQHEQDVIITKEEAKKFDEKRHNPHQIVDI